MADEGMKVFIEGKEYALDDFELGELEWLEDELGSLEDERAMRSMKAAVRFVTVIRRREDPDFSLDDARKLKMSVFDEPTPERPTKAAKAASKPAKSTPAASGETS